MAKRSVKEFKKRWEPCWESIGQQLYELAERIKNDIPDLKIYCGHHYNVGGGLFSGFMNLRNPLSSKEEASVDGFEIVITCWLRDNSQSFLEIECDTQFNPGPILSEISPIRIPLNSPDMFSQQQLDIAVININKFISMQYKLIVLSLQ